MRLYIFALIFLSLSSVRADQLDLYVREGLESNLALQQQNMAFEQSLQALREARGLYLPSISLEARYTRAGGGRDFTVPVGDLVNPINQTLNTLLGQNALPTDLQNETIPFLREKEHDTRLRLKQPLFQPNIYFNKKIKQTQTDIQKSKRDAFARTLVRDIKVAYFNHLKSVQLLEILSETQQVLNENLRVSEKLVEAEMATQDVVYRARAELAELKQQQTEAQRDSAVSAAYFNFLLNRSQDTNIVRDASKLTDISPPNLETAQQNARVHRDEFLQLQNALQIATQQIGLSRSAHLPNINFVYDYGFEGETYNFDGNHDFWMASVVLIWNLFDGFQKQARTQQQKLNKRKMETQQDELVQQIALQVRRAYHELSAAIQAEKAATERVESAQQSFYIVNRKYEEGLAPQIEFLDARNTRTRAEIQHLITTFTIHIRLAELEHASAMYVLEN
jgi:outer membrane protein